MDSIGFKTTMAQVVGTLRAAAAQPGEPTQSLVEDLLGQDRVVPTGEREWIGMLPPLETIDPGTRAFSEAVARAMNMSMASTVASPGGPLMLAIAGACADRMIPTAQEKAMAADTFEQMRAMYGYETDPALTGRLDELGAKVAAKSRRTDLQFRFHVCRDNEPNAMATPSGDIYVTRGLLQHLPEDGPLAFVLAHEIAHLEHRDAVRRRGYGKLDTILGEAAHGADEQQLGVLRETYQRLEEQKMAVTRQNEAHADHRGAEILVQLGFDAECGVAALTHLYGLENSEAADAAHPALQDRIATIREAGGQQG